MRTTSALVSCVAVFAAALGLQQYGAFAAPVNTAEHILFNGTVADPVKFLLESRALTGEFIGFHGTNAANAAVYQKQASTGGIPVPPAFNGADAELGPGIYVTDDITVAQFFATSSANANKNKGNTKNGASTPAICVVTAPTDEFVNRITKVWIPVNEIATSSGGRNDPAKLALQERRIANAHGTPTTAVRFSVLDVRDPTNTRTGNQLVIPSGVQSRFTIPLCVPLSSAINQLPAQLGHSAFPTFNYQNQRVPWHIV